MKNSVDPDQMASGSAMFSKGMDPGSAGQGLKIQNNYITTAKYQPFLAHMNHRFKVSFCDQRMSAVCPSGVCQ